MPPASPTKIRNDLTKVLDGSSGSPAPKTFSGRNCLLGSLVDSTFTCVAALSDCKAILCTEHGDICLLDDTDQRQRLEKVADAAFRILCISVDKEKGLVLLGGKDGKMRAIPAHVLMNCESRSGSLEGSPSPNAISAAEQGIDTCADILAVGSLRDRVIVVDASHNIMIRELTTIDDTASVEKQAKRISAHESAVLGVSALSQPNKRGADFITWSSQGTALFWTLDGICKDRLAISLEQSSSGEDRDANELKVLRASSSGDNFLFGDRNGNIGLLGKNFKTLRAHDGEVNDLELVQRDDGVTLVASCGRDRTVQLFQLAGDSLEILQTLENEHAASVNSLMFASGGAILLSASADRTVVIRTIAFGKSQTAAFFPTRVITMKSSPVSFTTLLGDPKTLIVSTMDRQLHHYDLTSGHLMHTFKATDSAKSESVLMSSIKVGNLQSEAYLAPVIFGVSSTDKSIRAYDSETGVLLAREYGQLVISDIAILQENDEDGGVSQFVISTGLDGTIMIWNLLLQSNQQMGIDGIVYRNATLSDSKSAQPLRRILSRSELSEYQRSLDASQDPPTPTRSQQPSRVRKKTSRLTLPGKPRHSAPSSSKSTHRSPSLSVSEATDHKHLRNPSPTVSSRKVTLASRTKRSSSDASRHHLPVATYPNDLVSSTKQLCQYIREYRERIDTSSDMLAQETAEQLERELALTIHAVGPRTKRRDEQSNEGANGNGSLDGWLAKMIDERLAVKLKNAESGNGEVRDPGSQFSSSSGRRESVLSDKV